MKFIRTYSGANSVKLKYFIYEENESLTVTCFAKYPDDATVEDAVDFATSNVNVSDPSEPINLDGQQNYYNLPNQPSDDVYTLMYKTTMGFDNFSEDELCDYSIIDLQTNNGEFARWGARLADTTSTKITKSARYRASSMAGTDINIKFPFASWNEGVCSVHAPESEVVEGNITFETIQDGTTSMDFTKWMDEFWHVHQTEAATVDADGYVNIPFKLRWNKDNSDCTRSTTLKVDDVNGYTPYNRTTTATDGTGTVRVGALGMVSGDEVKVKLNGNLVTNLGVLTATVN